MADIALQYRYNVAHLEEVDKGAYEDLLRSELADLFSGAEIDLAAGPGKTVLVTVDDDHLSNREIAALVHETQEQVREVAAMEWVRLATGEEWVPWP